MTLIKLKILLKKIMILKYKILNRLISIVYFIILVYILFFLKRRSNNQEYRNKINIYPFYSKFKYIKTINWNNINNQKDFLIDVLGNILMFIPFPIALFWLISIKISYKKYFIIIILTSVLIEILQYIFNKGVLDIDDIILNSIGGCLGLIILYYSFLKQKSN